MRDSMDDQEVIDWISHNMYLQIEKDMDIIIDRKGWDASDVELIGGHFEVREKFAKLIEEAYPEIKLNYEDFECLKIEWEEEKKKWWI